MKPVYFALLLFFAGTSLQLSAQVDSSNRVTQTQGHRDSLYVAKINYTGNLMIGGGVGLAAAGSFLIYEGVKIYRTPAAPVSTDPDGDIARNHKQGTAYIAAGTIAYVGTAVLIALGVKNKLEFKMRRKRMELQSGLLENGNMGAMLNF